MTTLPDTGFLRIGTIANNPKADPPTIGIIPVAPSTFWAGVRAGIYPKPIKLSPRVTVWRVEDIRAFIEESFSPSDNRGEE